MADSGLLDLYRQLGYGEGGGYKPTTAEGISGIIQSINKGATDWNSFAKDRLAIAKAKLENQKLQTEGQMVNVPLDVKSPDEIVIRERRQVENAPPSKISEETMIEGESDLDRQNRLAGNAVLRDQANMEGFNLESDKANRKEAMSGANL